MLGARRDRGVARTWFLKPLCERLNLLGKQLNLLKFVTGDEGLDKVTNWLGFRLGFEATFGNVHPAFS